MLSWRRRNRSMASSTTPMQRWVQILPRASQSGDFRYPHSPCKAVWAQVRLQYYQARPCWSLSTTLDTPQGWALPVLNMK